MRIMSKNLKINGEEMELNGDGSPLEENLTKLGRQVAHLRLVAANEHETAGVPGTPEDESCESLPVFEDEHEEKATVRHVPSDIPDIAEPGDANSCPPERDECVTAASVDFEPAVADAIESGDAKLALSERVENEIEAEDDPDSADVPDVRAPQDAESGPPHGGQCQPKTDDAGCQEVVAEPHTPAAAVFPAKIDLLVKWKFARIVASDSRLSRGAVACAFHLLDLYNVYRGRAWPSYETLATLTSAHRTTAIKAVKSLVELDYFTVQKGDGRRSNYYRPNFELLADLKQAESGSSIDATCEVASTPPLQPVEVAETLPNTSYNPVVPNGGVVEVSPRSGVAPALRAPAPSRGAPPGFEEFWEAYPRKEGRKLAIAAYHDALAQDGVVPELLAEKAKQYAEAKEATDPTWIKMPRTWLEDKCWLEDPQPPRPRTPRTRRAKPREPKSRARKSKTARSKTTAKSKAKKTPGPKPAKRQSKAKTNRSSSKQTQSSQPTLTPFGEMVVTQTKALRLPMARLSSAIGLRRTGLMRYLHGKEEPYPRFQQDVEQLLSDAAREHEKHETIYKSWLEERFAEIQNGRQ